MHPSHARPAGLLLGLAVLGAALLHQPGAIPARAEIAAPGAAAPPASGAAEPGGDLPTVEVTPHPVHAVPEGDPAPPLPVTIRGRDRRRYRLAARRRRFCACRSDAELRLFCRGGRRAPAPTRPLALPLGPFDRVTKKRLLARPRFMLLLLVAPSRGAASNGER